MSASQQRMDRALLQQLAELRVKDAETLLAVGRWDAAYYLLGYSVECALKACVAKQFRLHEVPEKTLVTTFYTHDFEKLLAVSGAKLEMATRAKADSKFEINWITVRDWNSDKRYEINVTEAIARGMYEAVTNTVSGVLPWLKTQW